MNSEKIPYQKQIFVCTNDRKGEKPSCGDHNGEEVFNELRRIAKEKGLHPKIRVAQAKCLGQCAQGVNVMVYSRRSAPSPKVGTSTPDNQPRASEPDEIWVKNVTLEDVPELAELYLK
jgi:predicted metal-binding protein